MTGKIICINKSLHKVLLENNTIIETTTRGKLRNEKIAPVVGDNVDVNVVTKTIEKVHARKNYLERPLVANIDKLLIVMSTSIPVFSSYLIDKFLLIALSNNIEPIIVITKMDMITLKEKLEIRKYISYYKKLGIKTYVNSNVFKIKKEFKDSVIALCGQTGAGKSSLLNKIDASLSLKTGEVSDSLGRGKHTTRLVELLEVNGGLIADTPGFSSLTLNIKKIDIKKYYLDFNKTCKYRTCVHDKESDCTIKYLVEKGRIPKWRYNNYLKLLEEGK
ncbi:MAG: ribosome small subunit-dependent GTPase A [Tenericutes bacterium]|nr:ribosome small subunit-dependent GTPase A [Mycoplasmatota bacterium]